MEELAGVQTAEVVSIFKKIEGGRTLAGMKVRDMIAERFDVLKNQCEFPSGFFAVVWDDEGCATPMLVRGARFPLMPGTLKSEVAEMLSQQCQFPIEEDDED